VRSKGHEVKAKEQRAMSLAQRKDSEPDPRWDVHLCDDGNARPKPQ
jgi:hypothetical protein